MIERSLNRELRWYIVWLRPKGRRRDFVRVLARDGAEATAEAIRQKPSWSKLTLWVELL